MRRCRSCSGRAGALCLAAAILPGCRRAEEPGAIANASLETGIVARVSEDSIAAATVGRIASSQGLDVRKACDRAIADALFAAEARRRLKNSATIRSIETATLARAVLEQLLSEARAEGPARDDEIAILTRERWVDLDRPNSVRTTHAVVLVKDPAHKARARGLAARIAEATNSAANSADFKRLAEAVPRGDLDVRVEQLPPTTLDGRVFDPNDPSLRSEPFDVDFARAANAIPEIGKNSGVVATKFGFHVIHLEERLPEKRVPIEERRKLLHEEIVAKRAALAQQRVLDGLRQTTPVQVDRAAVDLMSKLRVVE
jgi:hypothetical protein